MLGIITNNEPRNLLHWYELSVSEQAEHEEATDNLFFRYRGTLYLLSDFVSASDNPDLKGWDGYMNETFYSGILIKVVNNYDQVIVGRYYA